MSSYLWLLGGTFNLDFRLFFNYLCILDNKFFRFDWESIEYFLLFLLRNVELFFKLVVPILAFKFGFMFMFRLGFRFRFRLRFIFRLRFGLFLLFNIVGMERFFFFFDNFLLIGNEKISCFQILFLGRNVHRVGEIWHAFSGLAIFKAVVIHFFLFLNLNWNLFMPPWLLAFLVHLLLLLNQLFLRKFLLFGFRWVLAALVFLFFSKIMLDLHSLMLFFSNRVTFFKLIKNLWFFLKFRFSFQLWRIHVRIFVYQEIVGKFRKIFLLGT